MCTVSIFPKGKNDFVLTSNRDEAPNRKTLSPKMYSINNTAMLFPKDEVAGGTWIGVSEKSRLICLLNGGFEIYIRKPEYRKSRGVIVKDLLASTNIEEEINNYDLLDIEPFTLVIADWNSKLRFFELVWDGEQKHFSELPLEPKIWSSSTLYTEAMKAERKKWFNEFKSNAELSSNSILNFNKTAGNNEDYGVVMDRHFVKTTSVTQVRKTKENLTMQFENLQENTNTKTTFLVPQEVNE